MAETHQTLDSWYEVWFGPDDNRRHLKFHDEESMAAEVGALREASVVNIEVFKMSVTREPVSESELSWQ